MYNSKWDVVIEPHRFILAYPFSQDIDCKKSSQKSTYGNNAYILNPTSRLIHAYIHSDIIDINYQTMTIDIRQLYEISLIIYKYQDSIARYMYIYTTYQKFIHELSYTMIYRKYGISTKKEYIYFMFIRLIELISDFNLPSKA